MIRFLFIQYSCESFVDFCDLLVTWNVTLIPLLLFLTGVMQTTLTQSGAPGCVIGEFNFSQLSTMVSIIFWFCRLLIRYSLTYDVLIT